MKELFCENCGTDVKVTGLGECPNCGADLVTAEALQ